jgi:hypothetical protein
MQLPSIDRIPSLRPVAAESASLATGRVVPVAPVNPPVQAVAAEEPVPSVINMIGQADKSNTGEGVYSSVADPVRKDAAVQASADWTIKRPAPEKVEDPPPEPIYKMLMDHIKSLWAASASAVQVQQQVKDELDVSKAGVKAAQGVVATEVFTYSPTKINKTEKTQT